MLTLLALSAAHSAPVDRAEVAAHTAHVLPWGEVMVGTSGIHAGVLPRFQIGARPVLTALGLPTGSLRFAAVDTVPFDLAVIASGSVGTWPGARVSAASAGAVASFEIDRFGLHAGASHARIHAEGVPDSAPWWLPGDEDPFATLATGPGGGVLPRVHGGNTTLRAAAEVRLAGPLSLLAQGARTWSTVGASVGGDLPQELRDLSPVVGFEGIWTASASLKLEIGRVHLRGGVGGSNVPYAWLTQATAAHVRLGGSSAAEAPRTVVE